MCVGIYIIQTQLANRNIISGSWAAGTAMVKTNNSYHMSIHYMLGIILHSTLLT